MADHLKPTITSTYSNFVTELDARFDDLAVGLDPAVTTATNVPTGSIRWTSASNKWQKFNGTAYVDLSALYSINISGNAGTVTNGVYTTGVYSNPSWITALAGAKITGDISGNSGSANQLFTARNINGVAFNGTASISVNLNSTCTFNNSGIGLISGSSFNGGTATTISYNTIGAPSTLGTNASGTWGISVTGSAAALSTARTFTVGATGKSFDGSSAVSWTVAEILSTSAALSVASVSTTGNIASGGNITATGDISAGGNMTASSDETLKTNWRELPDNYVHKLSQLKSGIYDRIDTGQTQVGVSAQSLRTLLPDAVSLDNSNKLAVAYGNAALVSVIELAKEIVMLKEEIKLLKGGRNAISS